MSNRKIVGWYVMSPDGQQVAWHKTRQGARQIAARLSRQDGHIYFTSPEVEAA